MISNRSGKRLATTVLVIVVSVAMLTLALAATASASARGTPALAVSPASHHTIVVYPNGHDDTSDIQAAFNTCTSNGWTCTVQLVKGTYYTAQIAVSGFQGSFVGAGQGRTIIQALPNLPLPGAAYDTPTIPFWAGMPTGATGSNPWPDLFTFVNGTFAISGMTITEPSANPIVSPGWQYPAEYGDTTFTALYAVILITGEWANAAITQVTVNGAGGDLTIPLGTPSTFNLDSSITYEGMFLPSGWTDPFVDQIPLSGAFLLTDSVIYWSQSAFYMENLLSASVTVCFNSISSSPFPEFVDVSNSQLTFCGNTFTNIMYGGAILGAQSYLKTNLLPSTVYAVGNYIAANWEGSGIGFFDYGAEFYGLPSTLSAVVTGNTIVSDMSCGCYTGPIATVSFVTLSYSLVSSVWSGNLIEGGGIGFAVHNGFGSINNGPVTITGNIVIGADYGVTLHTANGELVSGNVIKNSLTYGIWVFGGSSYNVIALNLVKGSGVYDLYWDGTGTGNVWFGNVCQTSSPPGLC